MGEEGEILDQGYFLFDRALNILVPSRGGNQTIGLLINKRTDMSRSSNITSDNTDRIRWAVSHISYVLRQWGGVAQIFDREWEDNKADITIFCDIALEKEPVRVGSFGKAAFAVPSGRWFSTPWTEAELKESMREKKHSSTHLELLNMLEAVLLLAGEKQKVLCIGDNKQSVAIARARYSESANREMEERLHTFDVECCKRDLAVRFRWFPRTSKGMSLADRASRGEVPFALVLVSSLDFISYL